MPQYWQLFSILAGLIAAWGLFILGVMRAMLSRYMREIDAKLAAFGQIEKDYQRIERQVLEMKADMPLCYVRREDFIREEVTINTKLDRLRDLIEDKARAHELGG
jgi:hypothetical protein